MSSSEHDQAARDAIELLKEFSYFDQNVIQVVKAKLFQTFVATSLSQMQDIFGSVRRSMVFRAASPETEDQSLGVGGTLIDKIGYCIRYILLLVTMSSSEHDQAARDAIKLLEEFSYFDQNVIQVVKAKLFQTFIATSLSHSSLTDARHFRISSSVNGVPCCFTVDRRSVTRSWWNPS
ncbi:hypothetical protein KIW84_045586 [Lathyrus oleraceus]|uniref:Uncharacterized protein n=1 Tax=Pisum sativum TaxID=3888 RepID=A0A9D4XL12_PEA|nr:hypothetical protein KIW84_045586 [Pisum sativum]